MSERAINFEIGRKSTREEYEQQIERNKGPLKRFLKAAENVQKHHRVLEPEELPGLLQKENGGIFYAYFGRDREYTYHHSKTMNDVIDNLPYHNELCEDDLCKNTTDDGCRIDFRSDEWIIFPNESFVDEFCDEIIRRSPSDYHEDQNNDG